MQSASAKILVFKISDKVFPSIFLFFIYFSGVQLPLVVCRVILCRKMGRSETSNHKPKTSNLQSKCPFNSPLSPLFIHILSRFPKTFAFSLKKLRENLECFCFCCTFASAFGQKIALRGVFRGRSFFERFTWRH